MGNNHSTKHDDVQQTYKLQQKYMQFIQNIPLIWLDANIDIKSGEYHQTIAALKCVVNKVIIWKDSNTFIQFIDTIVDGKIYILVSGTVGQDIISHIHDLPQVDSIFVFCGNSAAHEQWVKQWCKIRGVFTYIKPLCETLNQIIKLRKRSAIPMSFVNTNGDISKKTLNEFDISFVYTQVLKDILFISGFEQEYLTGFIDHCFAIFIYNKNELKNIKKMEKEYYDKNPIWWFTYDCFLQSILNHAVNQKDLVLIMKMGFFIRDLHREIKKLYDEQFKNYRDDSILTLYRGQGITKMDFEEMKKNKGGLISFNSFLSTTKDPKIPIGFADFAARDQDLVGILFVIKMNPSKSTTPFADIKDIRCCDDQNEVLFSLHAIFRISDISKMDGDRSVYRVNLEVIYDSDKDLRMITDRIHQEVFLEKQGWSQLNLLLSTMDSDAPLFFEKALKIQQQSFPPNHPYLASCYNEVGNVYFNFGKYWTALTFYDKSLEIKQKSLPADHPNIGSSYNSIGLTYYYMNDYENAFLFHGKALKIRQQSLPPNHLQLAASYYNIGEVCRNKEEYWKALTFYDKSLEIKQKTLPSNHFDLAPLYYNIGEMYLKLKKYIEARTSYEKALAIFEQNSQAKHSDLVQTYNKIGFIYEKLGKNSEASSFYQRASN